MEQEVWRQCAGCVRSVAELMPARFSCWSLRATNVSAEPIKTPLDILTPLCHQGIWRLLMDFPLLSWKAMSLTFPKRKFVCKPARSIGTPSYPCWNSATIRRGTAREDGAFRHHGYPRIAQLNIITILYQWFQRGLKIGQSLCRETRVSYGWRKEVQSD